MDKAKNKRIAVIFRDAASKIGLRLKDYDHRDSKYQHGRKFQACGCCEALDMAKEAEFGDKDAHATFSTQCFGPR